MDTRKTLRKGNFKHTLDDSRTLLGIFRNRGKIKSPRGKFVFDTKVPLLSDTEAEALLRSALILSITAIEVYIEDALRDKFERELLLNAKTPEDISQTFEHAYASWQDTHKGHKKAEYDKAWGESGWKTTILEKFKNDIRNFHNPKSENINKLFKRYAGIDRIIAKCSWMGMPATDVNDTLDKIIDLRGKIVHKGNKLLSDYISISENDASQAIIFSEKFMACLEQKLFGS